MPPYDNNNAAETATMAANQHSRIDQAMMIETSNMDERRGDNNSLYQCNDHVDTDDGDDDDSYIPSTPPRLHKGAFAGFDECKSKRNQGHYLRPNAISSEPRPICRQRVGSDNCLPARMLFGVEEYDEDSWEPLQPLPPTIGLRQRVSPPSNVDNNNPRSRSKSPTNQREEVDESDAATVKRYGGAVARPRSRWIISSDHWGKVLWDIMTVVLSIANAHATHISIGKRNFGDSKFMIFCNLWFMVDIILNFITERKTAEGVVLRDYRSIWARYLTSWFAIDALSLLPWESVYVQPLFDLQKRRGFFQKSFFRSKAVVRVTRKLRGRHFRWFGTAAKHTRQVGIGANRLLRLVIKYLPKYILFFRNMKGVVVVRVLRTFHWWRRFYRNIILQSAYDEKGGDSRTGSITRDDFDDDDLSSNLSCNNGARAVVRVDYEGWEQLNDDDDYYDDDDDGVPL